MFRARSLPLSVASRLALKLALLSYLSLLAAHACGLIPDERPAQIRRKAAISESLAISSSLLARGEEDLLLEENLAAVVERNPDILSACIRRGNGSIVYQIGDHDRHWDLGDRSASTPQNVRVPIREGEKEWGAVEIAFAVPHGWTAWLTGYPLICLGLMTLVCNGIAFRWYLLRVLKYLDPARAVPKHVRSTLDTFAEGVVVLDRDQCIVLANDKFKRHVGKSEPDLLGRRIDELPWLSETHESVPPWRQSDDTARTGARLALRLGGEYRTYLVNASPILNSHGEQRGTIASFDDITALERNRDELNTMLLELKGSRDELRSRNEELQLLATRDSLTGCLNRRTFFEIFDRECAAHQRHQRGIGCLMVDVDNFKLVNDRHGHVAGDEVLRRVASTLMSVARESDAVCRYGGEEFCVLLPETRIEQAATVAERLRQAIAELDFGPLAVTASLGVSTIEGGTADPRELLEQADRSLYYAKHRGRNRVIRWDLMQRDLAAGEGDNDPSDQPILEDVGDASIPYPAVASLLSALAYRDAETAAHSTRVAELSVATASGLLSVKHTYVLEIAALLHDIGKIGVPDADSLKPGPLTDDEWRTMQLHERIGGEIIEASFSNERLLAIIRYRHAKFAGSDRASHFPKGQEIPIGARIIAIADAYDAMTSDRVYRKGRTQAEAFRELRKCAGEQFDPELVERFISVIKHHKPIVTPIGSKQTALQVGLQIEKLAQAIDERDDAGIQALAARLEKTAARGGVREIESVANRIKIAADGGGDLISLLQMVDELMTLCRSTQRAYADPRFDAARDADYSGRA